jgi:hypothetical protein
MGKAGVKTASPTTGFKTRPCFETGSFYRKPDLLFFLSVPYLQGVGTRWGREVKHKGPPYFEGPAVITDIKLVFGAAYHLHGNFVAAYAGAPE